MTTLTKLPYRKMGFYEKYIKRVLDILCALAAIIVFSWLFIIVAILVRTKLGSPVIFKQPRPGLVDPKTGQERIFDMYKFRSMTNAKDKDGNLLPDEQRLTGFGKLLRGSSMDELPEAFNILKGDMSVIGPRPQLVRDMVFMTDEQRMRHTARPGLSGLAQVNGRNNVSWEQKIKWDLSYVEKISFIDDMKILFLTIKKVFGKGESTEELALTNDYGDALLLEGKITIDEYRRKQEEARKLINRKCI